MRRFTKKICLLIMGILSFNLLTVYANADTTNKLNDSNNIESRVMYQWNTSVELYGRQSTKIKGPSGNNYNFTTTNSWIEQSYYSELSIKSSEKTNLEIYATDVKTGEKYYALQSGYYFNIYGLPSGTFSLTVKDTGTSGALRKIDFYVETRNLVYL